MTSRNDATRPTRWSLRPVLLALLLTGIASTAQAQEPGPLDACIATLRSELPQHPEVRTDTFDLQTRDVTDLRPTISNATQSQPEFKLPVWDYMARLVDTRRIAEGKAVLAAQAGPLRVIDARRGVDAATAVAVFGVETDYGRVVGRYRVVDATLSRACLDLASQERKRHFYAALWLLQENLVEPTTFLGSWAGAFGLTQFMPGTFKTYRDGIAGPDRVDIVGNPADALATTANFIAGSGWVPGLRWGVEVKAPPAVSQALAAAEREHACVASPATATAADMAKCRTVAQWAAMGVAPITPVPSPGLAPDTRVALLAPAGSEGPAWLVSANFQAIWQYNRADAYALAIGLLSDALRGDPPLRGAWPTDDIGLSRDEMRALQQRLIQRGHADVVADGVDGPRTREAIRQEETSLGWPETGRAGSKLMRALTGSVDEGATAAPASAPGADPSR